MSERTETKTEMMGTKMVQRAKRLTVYKITRDLGKGWFRIALMISTGISFSGYWNGP